MTKLSVEKGPTGSALDSEELFTVLSNRRRRYTLHHLLQQDNRALGLRELAEQVAAWENCISLQRVSYDQRRNVYTALKQTHLPRLSDAGIVEYDEREGRIELTGSADRFDVYMDVVSRGDTIPWSEFYLGMGAVLSALTVLKWIGLPPLDFVPSLAWTGIVLACVVGAGAAHYYVSQQMRLGADGPPPELKYHDRRVADSESE